MKPNGIFLIIWNSFWLLFMLFFAIPFPMLIYYATQAEVPVSSSMDKDPITALIVLGISVVLWGLLIIGYFKNWILSVFIAKRNIEYIKGNGAIRQAEILSSEKISKPGSKREVYELTLSFKNLADSTIVEKTTLNDAKPYERRFEKGKRLEIIIDKSMKRKPYFVISTTEAHINVPILLLKVAGWIIFLALVLGYYVYAYQDESMGAGWRFLSFGHPLIVCPMILFLYRCIARLIKRYVSSISEKIFIKFKGVKTNARLMKVSQTGVYINEQPQIKFELEFTDQRNQVHRASLKRTIGLLQLDMTKQEQADIFYLPEDPKRIALAIDLDELNA